MNRRSVLASLGGGMTVAFAGCTALEGLTSSRPDEIKYGVIADEVPEERPLHHDVAIQQPYFRSADAPFTLDLSVTNTTDEVIEYGDRRSVRGLKQANNDFVLLSEDSEFYEFDPEEELWMGPGTIGMDGDYQTEKLDPSETHSQPLVVVVKNEDSVPEAIPSEIEFTLRFSAGPTEEFSPSKDRFGFSWSFALQRQ